MDQNAHPDLLQPALNLSPHLLACLAVGISGVNGVGVKGRGVTASGIRGDGGRDYGVLLVRRGSSGRMKMCLMQSLA